VRACANLPQEVRCSLSLSLSLFLLGTDARAQSAPAPWALKTVYTAALDDVPIGLAMRQHGPSGEVFIAVETRERLSVQPRKPHDLRLVGFTCDPLQPACDTPSLHPLTPSGPVVIATSANDVALLPSMALRAGPLGRELRLVHRLLVEPDCDGNGTPAWEEPFGSVRHKGNGIAETVWNTSVGFVETNVIQQNTPGLGLASCIKRGVSYSEIRNGRL
jgi:hypothetical protein